jgi:hypothetical protein
LVDDTGREESCIEFLLETVTSGLDADCKIFEGWLAVDWSLGDTGDTGGDTAEDGGMTSVEGEDTDCTEVPVFGVEGLMRSSDFLGVSLELGTGVVTVEVLALRNLPNLMLLLSC